MWEVVFDSGSLDQVGLCSQDSHNSSFPKQEYLSTGKEFTGFAESYVGISALQCRKVFDGYEWFILACESVL